MHVREARKLVTVLFCDLADSTALADARDPEAVRGVLSRYYAVMRAVLERHGAEVEKFIGDAVVGIFGVPTLREDDAERAVRAAAAIIEELARLNAELEQTDGVRLAVRIGVNTGTALVREGSGVEGLAYGDPVNVAARLQQSASAGEVLIGEETLRLVGDAVLVAPIEAVEVKGKPVAPRAARLIEVLGDVPAFERPLRSGFVGRVDELRQLDQLVASAQEGQAHMVTVVGPAGIGKSRLIRELVTRQPPGGELLVARCLAYGEGITYWPLDEILRQLDRRPGGLRSLVAGDPDEALISSRLAAARGAAIPATPGEIAWAVRRLLERLAQAATLVVFDDIHWAEPPMLDLIEYLGAMTRAPIVFACAARPELFELRPDWATPRPHSHVMSLDALTDAETLALCQPAVSSVDSGGLVERVVEWSAGNPLFAEQLLAAAADGSLGEEFAPASIRVLLASRIDQLPPAEQDTLLRASVEGRLFHRGALLALLDGEAEQALDAAVLALVRKQLIRLDRSEFPGDDGFRFVHALVQDAAYDAAPKALRAELHERYADWLESRVGGDLAEVQEILGYHLEQAYRLRVSLRPVDDQARALALRASRHLASAAARADGRWDSQAVLSLLERAQPLYDGHPAWLEVALMHAFALAECASRAQALAALDATIEAAEAVQRSDIAWQARLLRSMSDGSDPDLVRREAEQALETFGPNGDPSVLTAAWRNLAFHRLVAGNSTGAQEASRRCMEIARRASSHKMTSVGLAFYLQALVYGPTPAEECIRVCRELLAGDDLLPVDRVSLNASLGCLSGMRANADETRRCIDEVARLQVRRGKPPAEEGLANVVGPALILIGDVDRAEQWLRSACEEMRARGQLGVLSTAAAILGHLLLDSSGDAIEAERWCQESERLTEPGDVASEALWRTLRAKLFTAAGDPERGLPYARAAVGFLDATDWPNETADALVALAQVATAAGDRAAADAAVERATPLYCMKGNLVGERRALRFSSPAGAPGLSEQP